MLTDKTLLEQMRINELEIFHRMKLLDLTTDDLDLLASYKRLIEGEIETIVEEFYRLQTRFDEIAIVIGDSETMRRLRLAQHKYILELFSGYYDGEYVNSRLRIGLVHKRIGVEPKLFLSGVANIQSILGKTFKRHLDPDAAAAAIEALSKLIYFDVTLVFDTYIDTMVSEVESAKRRAESYAHAMEDKARTLSSHAERDSLTELYNKRGMTNFLRNELRLAQRRRSLLSLIYIDVNKFKTINDTFGHSHGDQVLIRLADCIRKNVRSKDFPCRIGGDEFCIILPECDERSARTIGKRINEEFRADGTGHSISVGVVETGGQEYLELDQLLNMADERMYDDKVERGAAMGSADQLEPAMGTLSSAASRDANAQANGGG